MELLNRLILKIPWETDPPLWMRWACILTALGTAALIGVFCNIS